MTGQIFIRYRREENRWSARSLCDRLVTRFDRKQIFMDIDAIALGDDFIKEIEKRVGDCDVLIAVIGSLPRMTRAGGGSTIPKISLEF